MIDDNCSCEDERSERFQCNSRVMIVLHDAIGFGLFVICSSQECLEGGGVEHTRDRELPMPTIVKNNVCLGRPACMVAWSLVGMKDAHENVQICALGVGRNSSSSANLSPDFAGRRSAQHSLMTAVKSIPVD